MSRALPPVAAIVLAGGRASRLGGVDKASVQIDGLPLVDLVYAAVKGCAPVVGVGPESIVRPGVRVVREDPPFGGPVAGIRAALDVLDGTASDGSSAAETWLLACDLPRAGALVDLLSPVEIPGDADAIIAVDADGRQQWLAGRYRVGSLRRAVDALPEIDGASMRSLVSALVLHGVPDAGTALDLDTWSAIEDHRSSIREDHHD